jgi:hypothetical protein
MCSIRPERTNGFSSAPTRKLAIADADPINSASRCSSDFDYHFSCNKPLARLIAALVEYLETDLFLLQLSDGYRHP